MKKVTETSEEKRSEAIQKNLAERILFFIYFPKLSSHFDSSSGFNWSVVRPRRGSSVGGASFKRSWVDATQLTVMGMNPSSDIKWWGKTEDKKIPT